MKELENVGLRIKYVRKSKHITQGRLGDMVGVSRQTIINIENGRSFGLCLAIKIAEALETKVGYFVGERKKP